MYQSDVKRFIWILVLVAVTYSAPARDASVSKQLDDQETNKDMSKDEQVLVTKPPSSEENTDNNPALQTAAESSEEQGAKSEEESENKEVVDYQTIQKDSDSKVRKEKQENEVFDQKQPPVLSDEEADQLMMLMSDPVAIAEYLAVSGDIVGFLEVLDTLQMNGFIDGKVVDRLKNEVSSELDRLLIEKDAEENQMYENEVYPAPPQNEVYMENEMLNIIKQIMTLPVLTPGEVYQAMLYEGASDLVASVAGLVYQRIIEREITPEAGVSLVAAVFQLSLPNEYIPEDVTDESFYEDAFLDYVLETMSQDENMINNDVIDNDDDSQEENVEDIPLKNSAGKQIGEEQKVHSLKPLKTKEGKTIGKEVHDEFNIQAEDGGGSLEEELQDIVMGDGNQDTNGKSSSESENLEGFGSGESEIEYLLEGKDMEELPDMLKMKLKNYFKAVDNANSKLHK
ncbi:uncharacterized protein [Antedon mediterranea]|uniref:uncharacterized protein n=1 Tax=Antedon mediterranea TaxID=105859 RepID=UPI003AF74118